MLYALSTLALLNGRAATPREAAPSPVSLALELAPKRNISVSLLFYLQSEMSHGHCRSANRCSSDSITATIANGARYEGKRVVRSGIVQKASVHVFFFFSLAPPFVNYSSCKRVQVSYGSSCKEHTEKHLCGCTRFPNATGTEQCSLVTKQEATPPQ